MTTYLQLWDPCSQLQILHSIPLCMDFLACMLTLTKMPHMDYIGQLWLNQLSIFPMSGLWRHSMVTSRWLVVTRHLSMDCWRSSLVHTKTFITKVLSSSIFTLEMHKWEQKKCKGIMTLKSLEIIFSTESRNKSNSVNTYSCNIIGYLDAALQRKQRRCSKHTRLPSKSWLRRLILSILSKVPVSSTLWVSAIWDKISVNWSSTSKSTIFPWEIRNTWRTKQCLMIDSWPWTLIRLETPWTRESCTRLLEDDKMVRLIPVMRMKLTRSCFWILILFMMRKLSNKPWQSLLKGKLPISITKLIGIKVMMISTHNDSCLS